MAKNRKPSEEDRELFQYAARQDKARAGELDTSTEPADQELSRLYADAADRTVRWLAED